MGKAATYVELGLLSVGAAYAADVAEVRFVINTIYAETGIYIEATEPGLIQDAGEFARALAHAPPPAYAEESSHPNRQTDWGQ
jgi:hypothetical protein